MNAPQVSPSPSEHGSPRGNRAIRGGRLTRRRALRAALIGAIALRNGRARGEEEVSEGDVAIDGETALVFSKDSPLAPAEGKKDAKAVWCRVPKGQDGGVLLYFHGHNGYVTVDEKGLSRVPDWAEGDEAAKAGAMGKQAAPLVYKLDKLGGDRGPVVMAPEVSTLGKGSFWAREPAGQYADPKRLGALVADTLGHLACLKRPDGRPYLAEGRPGLGRVYLSGHSGAGLPLEEAAGSALILPEGGRAADLWLFDCTYWSKVAGFVRFCERWHAAGRLKGGNREASRFVCIYKPGTQTEEVADELRGEVAKALGVAADSLVRDHSPTNLESEILPALGGSGALFLKTHLPHDEIPTAFLPILLGTAAG